MNANDRFAWMRNPGIFPLSAKVSYSTETQVKMDMFNLHNARQMLDQGYQMSVEDLERFVELRFKELFWDAYFEADRAERVRAA